MHLFSNLVNALFFTVSCIFIFIFYECLRKPLHKNLFPAVVFYKNPQSGQKSLLTHGFLITIEKKGKYFYIQ